MWIIICRGMNVSKNVSVFRMDRIWQPEVLDEKAVKRPKRFKLDDYSKPIFDMFEGSERVEVKLECRNDLALQIGMDISIMEKSFNEQKND